MIPFNLFSVYCETNYFQIETYIRVLFSRIKKQILNRTQTMHVEKSCIQGFELNSMETSHIPAAVSERTVHYTGWPRKNATPMITNFKEIRDYCKSN